MSDKKKQDGQCHFFGPRTAETTEGSRRKPGCSVLLEGGCIVGDIVDENNPGDAIHMTCTNTNCDQPKFIHLICYQHWEDELVKLLSTTSWARSWTEEEKRTHLWDRKGFLLIAKACKCLCGLGQVKRHPDYKPPEREEAIMEGNKKNNKKLDASEVRRPAMIHLEEMREQLLLNERDRMNQELHGVDEQIAELSERKMKIQQQLALSEQRLAKSKEQHSIHMNHLNGRVHELHINSSNQSQEAPTASEPLVLSLVSSEKGESTGSGDETLGLTKVEGSKGNRVPWNWNKLDLGQSSSNKQSENHQTVMPMGTDEPQSTVVLIEEDDKVDTDEAEIQEVGSQKKHINVTVERVMEWIRNVRRHQVVHALLKVQENMLGNFGKQKLSELVGLVVLELTPEVTDADGRKAKVEGRSLKPLDFDIA